MGAQTTKGELLKPKVGMVFMMLLGFGAIIGPWMIQMPWYFSLAGPAVGLAFFVSAILMTPIVFAYGELVPMLPFAGGEWIFTRHAFGRATAWLVAWLLFWVYVDVNVFMGFSVVRMGQVIFGIEEVSRLAITLIAIVVLLIFSVINYFGVKVSIWTQFFMTLLLGLIGYVIAFMFIGSSHWTTANFTPFFATGAGGWLTAVGILVVMYVGFDVVPQMAEEAKYPRHRQIWVMLGAIWLTASLYILMCTANAGMMPTSWIMEQLVVSPEILKMHWGLTPWVFVNIAALATILTCFNAFLLGASRLVFSLGRSRTLPPFLSHVNKYNVPDYGLWFVCIIAILFIAAAGEQWVEIMLSTAGVAIGVVYGLVSLSATILRKSHPDWPRPYKMPWGTGMGIVGAIIGLICAVFSSFAVPGTGWIMLIIYLVIGLVIYLWMASKSKSDAEAYGEIIMTPDDITEDRIA
ncbi:APC family permease [Thermodesulfobacteriota bacterium]